MFPVMRIPCRISARRFAVALGISSVAQLGAAGPIYQNNWDSALASQSLSSAGAGIARAAAPACSKEPEPVAAFLEGCSANRVFFTGLTERQESKGIVFSHDTLTQFKLSQFDLSVHGMTVAVLRKPVPQAELARKSLATVVAINR